MSLNDAYAVYVEKGGRSPQPAQAGKVLCYAPASYTHLTLPTSDLV